ncbi:protein kinase domain-containing protein [Streptomyces sp. NPDC003635]
MPLHKDDPKSVGGYRLVDRLGAGGMGVVYRGRARSGREVAVKVVHAQYAEDPVFRARFRQEIEAVRKVSGAFTAPVVDADPEAVRPWMATQYVPGRSLAARIRDVGPLREPELRRLALGLVEALRDIHRAGVVHRDLKPANVLLADDGPRVIDFGISRAAENNTLTETGQMIGTPPFMSPEQLTDARSVGPSSDVFSLGALLVYTVTGRGPFDADSPYLTAYRVVHDTPVLDGVGLPLRAILERCLAKEAKDRPVLDELAQEFATALPAGEADDDPPTVALRREIPTLTDGAGTDPGAYTAPGRRRRLRPLWAATGTVGALVLGLTAYLLAGPDRAASDSGAPAAVTEASRWGALPKGWKPWETTAFEKAPLGARDALTTEGGRPGGEPSCRMYEGDVYCAGEGALPVRLDGSTGRTLWRAEVAPSSTDSAMYSSSAVAAVDDTLIVRQTISTDSPEMDPAYLIGLDVDTGEQLWKHRANEENLELGLAGGMVLTSDDGRTVTARSPRTGAERWSAEMPADHYCTFPAAGTGVYAQCTRFTDEATNSQLLTLDPADGSTRRRTTLPLASGVLGELDGRLVVLEWTEPADLSIEGNRYDRIMLVDPDTGALTSTRLATEYPGEASLAGGELVFVSSSGRVTAVSPRTGKQLWQTQTSLESPGPAVHDERTHTLYLATISGRVVALDSREGDPLWETLPRAQVASGGIIEPEALLNEGALVVATPGGTVFTLDPAHPDRKPVSG